MSDWAVITTLNEEQTIGDLVRALVEQDLRVLVVDDGSTDKTVAEALSAHATVLATGPRAGIGPALMKGWRRALYYGARRIVQIDAGGSHNPLAARQMLAIQDATDAAIVVGSRFVCGSLYKGEASPLRPFLSRAAAVACNLATGANYADWTSGYRVFKRDAALRLLQKHYNARMHGWQIEVLAQANAMGMRIVEWPIEYTAGRSSFNWRVAHEASNSWLHVFFHIGGCTDNKRLSVQADRSLSIPTVRTDEGEF